MTRSVRKETSMDKPRAAQLLRLEILRREALARASSFPVDHLQVAQALTLAVQALEEETHEDRRENHLDPRRPLTTRSAASGRTSSAS